MTVHAGANAGTYFYAYDGNGNVIALINAADGTVAARHVYGPFGEMIRATGPLATVNLFRFSSKYQDDESDLLYYGYRFYSPSLGRWLSRDPIDENGGNNLMAFTANDSVNGVDKDGRIEFENCPPALEKDVRRALAKACDKILGDGKFSCCMGEGLGGDAKRKLGKLCSSRDFKVRCAGPPPKNSPRKCARGDDETQTITLYDGFFGDGCGWGKECVMAHEMLHLTGVLHLVRNNDTLFNLLHACLGCPKYTDR